MPYLSRLADKVIADVIGSHPAAMIVGPRATGKTTTAAKLAASQVRLTDVNERVAVAADPMVALTDRPEPILVDEWQVIPETLNAIKLLVDEAPRRGRFIVTGSVRGELDSPTWPGTGRLVRVPMFGLTEREVQGNITDDNWLGYVLAGHTPPPVRSSLTLRDYVARALRSGFPEPALELDERGRHRWLASYVDQLVTRDAEGVDGGRDPERLRRYLTAVALNSAGIVDDVTLYEAARISKATAKAYERLLANLLIVEQLPAWTPNRLKRLSLASKRYLVDPGLFTGILGVTQHDVLTNGDLLGRVIDTFVTAQLRAECALRLPAPRLHHLRTEKGRQEVDLIIETAFRKLVAIEVKATSSPGPDDARHLRWLRREFADQVDVAILLHTGPQQFVMDEGIIAAPIAALWS
ncbi:MAG TPA: ATP-binding protein [Acidimicrobiaceae bacterium]|nr:ATP-binding protein [Acidimicrobiaceae bacterium]